MTTWHWVRHGPTHETSFVGWRDVPADLSDIAQIARLKEHLPKTALMISSDLSRCVATADALEADDHTRLDHAAELREIHFGVWDGMHFSDVAARDPQLSRAFWETPGDVAAPDGESWNQTAARVNQVVDALTKDFPGADIIAVAHFGVILTQVQRALRATPAQAIGYKIDNLSVTTLRSGAEGWVAEHINHLP